MLWLQLTYDINVGLFVATTDVVGFADPPVLKTLTQPAAVISHVKPITDLLPVAVEVADDQPTR